jgi:hypothetical protein
MSAVVFALPSFAMLVASLAIAVAIIMWPSALRERFASALSNTGGEAAAKRVSAVPLGAIRLIGVLALAGDTAILTFVIVLVLSWS